MKTHTLESFIVRFLTRNVRPFIFIEGGYNMALSRSQKRQNF